MHLYLYIHILNIFEYICYIIYTYINVYIYIYIILDHQIHAARNISLTTMHTLPPTPKTKKKDQHHHRPSPLKQKHHDTRGTLAARLPARRWCRHGLFRQRTSGSDDGTFQLGFPMTGRDDSSVQRLLEGWTVDKRRVGRQADWFNLLKDSWISWIIYMASTVQLVPNCTFSNQLTPTIAPWQPLHTGIVCVAWNPIKKVRNHCTIPSPWRRYGVVEIARWLDTKIISKSLR